MCSWTKPQELVLEEKYKHLSDLSFCNIKIFKNISLLCSRLSMTKDYNVGCPLPTAMTPPMSTQANTDSYMCPFLDASIAESLSLEMQEAGQQDHCLLPHKGLQQLGLKPSRDHQVREPFLALQMVVRGGRQRGAHNCPDVAFSLVQLYLPSPVFSI